MSTLAKFITVSTILQIAMVITGHYIPAVLNQSAVLGTSIPLVVGGWFGATGASSGKSALRGGFLIGVVGAVIGIVIAIVIGDAAPILLTFGPLSSGVTGLLGAVILHRIAGRTRAQSAA